VIVVVNVTRAHPGPVTAAMAPMPKRATTIGACTVSGMAIEPGIAKASPSAMAVFSRVTVCARVRAERVRLMVYLPECPGVVQPACRPDATL
jgi:hypothetical protein